MKVWGYQLSRKEIEARVPNIRQICGTRPYELVEGATRGTRVIDVDTGALRYSVVLDRGMDISLASYKGVNLTHLTENGEIHPAFYESRANEWARIFFGGLLTTCGLTYLGPAGRDGDEELGLHGRYSAIPARYVRDVSGWNEDEYDLILEGQIDESVQMGEKIRLQRRIASRGGDARIHIRDVVTNTGTRATPFTILYHINFGFPLLDAGTRLIMQGREAIPFDAHSCSRIASRLEMSRPCRGNAEENYFCPSVPDGEGRGCALIVNDDLLGGLGVLIRVSAGTLPYFCEWKMLDERDYILAVEPCNVICENRGVLRKNGKLPMLRPGECRQMDVEIGVLEGKDSISKQEREILRVIQHS